MTSKANSPGLDDLDNYFLDGDLDDDPFASPKGNKSDSNKRKKPGDGLGLDEEVSVEKKARVPRIKLDQDRLLSQKGIPALRRRARGLKLKGKGHEWGDASRLLSFYQEWLDDLFPKAKFLDALAMVEKAGHNRSLAAMRVEWINEGKPKSTVVDDGGEAQATEQDQQSGDKAPKQAERIAPVFDKIGSGGPQTPDLDDLFGGDDIYNATPVGARTSVPTATNHREGGQEEDDREIDALIAADIREPNSRQAPAKSGGGIDDDDDGDDLDALMAEAEAHAESVKVPGANEKAAKENVPEFNDEEEAMAEMDGLW